MVLTVHAALPLRQQDRWCNQHCATPNKSVRVLPLLRASQFLPRQALAKQQENRRGRRLCTP